MTRSTRRVLLIEYASGLNNVSLVVRHGQALHSHMGFSQFARSRAMM